MSTRIRKPNGEGYMTTAEFRNRIRQICGVKPEGYYNPPVKQPPTLVTKADLAARKKGKR